MNEHEKARLFISDVAANLEAITHNLRAVGYLFSRKQGPIQYATDSDRLQLANIAKEHGPLPSIFSAWYEHFRQVDFTQETGQFNDTAHPLSRLGMNCPLVFLNLESCLLLRDNLIEQHRPIALQAGFFLPTGAFASNCDPCGVLLPSQEFDPPLYDDGEGPVRMGQVVRSAINAGGFPFWNGQRQRASSYFNRSAEFFDLIDRISSEVSWRT